jgi:REP element-mobilizing transposase RayT
MGKSPKFNIPGHAHFVTTKTFENKPLFNDIKCCEIVLKDIEFYRQKMEFSVLGYCLMPNHLHIILWWDVEKHGKLTVSKIIQAIKGHSAKEITYYLKTGRRKPSLSPYSAASEGSRLPRDYKWVNHGQVHTPVNDKIWQPSFYDFNIYSEYKLRQKLDHVHWNPVHAGLCKNPEDWPWSSYNDYVHHQSGLIKTENNIL